MPLGYGAWFVDHHAEVPVFHRVAAWPDLMRTWMDGDREHHTYVALCGRVLEHWSFVRTEALSHRDHARALTMRVDHAEKFGRLCRNCAKVIDRA